MTAESVWWHLSLNERLYLERAVSAIVRYYDGHPLAIYRLILIARHQHYNAPIQQAILWRLEQEIS